MPYVIIDDIVVWEPDTGTSTIVAQDGTLVSFSPVSLIRVDANVQSANEVTRLIDGSIAVRLVGDMLASGTITMLFSNDTDMATARSILARPTAFQLSDPTRPIVNMLFVRNGSLNPGMHDQVRDVWEFRFDFQEIEP